MKPLRDLPNLVGFRFLGVLRDGSTRECVVELRSVLREDGTPTVHQLHTVDQYHELMGWKELPKQK